MFKKKNAFFKCARNKGDNIYINFFYLYDLDDRLINFDTLEILLLDEKNCFPWKLCMSIINQ